jgi:hypothetical protein
VVINLSLSRSLEATGVVEEMVFVKERERVVRKRECEAEDDGICKRERERNLGLPRLVNVVLQ